MYWGAIVERLKENKQKGRLRIRHPFLHAPAEVGSFESRLLSNALSRSTVLSEKALIALVVTVRGGIQSRAISFDPCAAPKVKVDWLKKGCA